MRSATSTQPLGFEVTYEQVRPNPYLALRGEGIDLPYFGIEGFRPKDLHGSCLVVAADTQPLFDAFACPAFATSMIRRYRWLAHGERLRRVHGLRLRRALPTVVAAGRGDRGPAGVSVGGAVSLRGSD